MAGSCTFEQYRPISRLGGNWYGSTDRIFAPAGGSLLGWSWDSHGVANPIA